MLAIPPLDIVAVCDVVVATDDDDDDDSRFSVDLSNLLKIFCILNDTLGDDVVVVATFLALVVAVVVVVVGVFIKLSRFIKKLAFVVDIVVAVGCCDTTLTLAGINLPLKSKLLLLEELDEENVKEEDSNTGSCVEIAGDAVESVVDATTNCGLKSMSIKPVTCSATAVAINYRDFREFYNFKFFFHI